MSLNIITFINGAIVRIYATLLRVCGKMIFILITRDFQDPDSPKLVSLYEPPKYHRHVIFAAAIGISWRTCSLAGYGLSQINIDSTVARTATGAVADGRRRMQPKLS